MLPGHPAFGGSSAARALASVDVPPTLLVGHTVAGQTFLLGHRTLPPFGQLAKGPRSFYSPIAEVVVERPLTHAAYDNRILPSGMLEPARLAILADALEEAGCDNTEILDHL